ncbi:MAG: hypothetical protein C6P37_08340 [Caldibacillus debilis]|uniref:Uncharacterized protein n=1 Tax=Caldibacillus debilis TaxID=301148 RepID=A0A3E0K5B6_9BACI|nr:MAG: hypothetical protein BAA03_15365 [Caldibacillus debilis]REJ28638.1 MAG: hypothetical protein C6P37_08340 [Caldibacillus debilis]
MLQKYYFNYIFFYGKKRGISRPHVPPVRQVIGTGPSFADSASPICESRSAGSLLRTVFPEVPVNRKRINGKFPRASTGFPPGSAAGKSIFRFRRGQRKKWKAGIAARTNMAEMTGFPISRFSEKDISGCPAPPAGLRGPAEVHGRIAAKFERKFICSCGGWLKSMPSRGPPLK